MTPIEGTTDELGRLRELERAATPGPWRQTGTAAKPHWYVTSDTALVHGNFPATREDYHPDTIRRWIADAALIAAARNALPLLLDVAEAAREYVTHYGYPVPGIDKQLDKVADALAALQASQGADDDPTA